MAFSLYYNGFNIFLAVLCSLSLFLSSSYGLILNPKPNNATKIQNENQWLPATASPMGGGSDGGACGYADALEGPQFSEILVSAGGPSLFWAGNGCGACYEVRCTEYNACSEKPVTVVIADACTSCISNDVDFDLSKSAFAALVPALAKRHYRVAPIFKVLYRSIACKFAMSLAVKINPGSSTSNLGLKVEFKIWDEISSVSAVDVKEAQSDSWHSMKFQLDNSWILKTCSQLKAPFSIKLNNTDKNGTRTIVEATDLIPAGWQVGQIYRTVSLKVHRI